MNKAFDIILKTLVETDPRDWPLVVNMPVGPLTVVDADVSAVGGAADKVLRVEANPTYFLHLDFFTGHDTAHAPRKLRWYNAVLDVRHNLMVQSVAVLLRPEADSPRLTGELTRQFPGRPPHVVFRYEVMRVWRMPVETFLGGSLSLLPLAPVSAVPEAELPSVIEEMKRRLSGRKARAMAGDLWSSTFVLLGLKYSQEMATQLLRGITAMEESTTYQMIVDIGKKRGREEGSLEEARQILLIVGRKRFGPPDAATLAAVQAISDRGQLEALVEKALDVPSWQELIPPPRRGRSRRR